MNISVGIPTYDGKLPIQLVDNLLTESTLAQMMGHRLIVRFLPSCCNLALGRNQLAKEFMQSKDDRLVFVDADITFEPGSLIRIASYPVDVVGGAYRKKVPNEEYPVGWLPGELREKIPGLLEVRVMPTGFLSLSRKVFEDFQVAYPQKEYVLDGERVFCYFEIPYRDGVLYTEDSYFCREWREAGGKIYLDPDITLTHWKFNEPFIGNVGDWLRRLNGLEKSERKTS